MKTVLGLAGIAFLALLAGVAGARSWADLQAYQGRSFMATWEKRADRPAAAEWALAQTRLERALALDSGDAALTEDLGRLHEMRTRAGLPESAGPASATELGRALDYLRQSLARRPTSPYTWANIAVVKSRLGEFDEELFRAIANAARLGPWEPGVQFALADLGLGNWARLPRATQDIVQGAIGRGLKRQDQALFDLAAGHDRMSVMCATPGVARSKLAIRCI